MITFLGFQPLNVFLDVAASGISLEAVYFFNHAFGFGEGVRH